MLPEAAFSARQVALLIMVTLTLFPILQRTIPESYQARAIPQLACQLAAGCSA